MAAEWKLLMMTTTTIVLPLPLVSSSSHPPWSSSSSTTWFSSLETTSLPTSTLYPPDDYDLLLSALNNTTITASTYYNNNNNNSSNSSSSSSFLATASTLLMSTTTGGGVDSLADVIESEEAERFPAYVSLLMMLSCGLILVVGLVGNCLVPVVIWNNRDLRNSTNLFLLNLSLADILVLCVSMPTVLVEIYERRDTWIFGKIMCKSFILHSIQLKICAGACHPLLSIHRNNAKKGTLLLLRSLFKCFSLSLSLFIF
jgi:hypothetical protein